MELTACLLLGCCLGDRHAMLSSVLFLLFSLGSLSYQ